MRSITATTMITLFTAMPLFSAEPPPFNNLRYEENSAAYKDVQPATKLDELKYIPLGDSESMFVSFGGQARIRGESWNNFNFDPANDDDYGLLRLMLHGDLHLGEHVRTFVELKSATATDRNLPGGRRTLDVDEFDVQNAFLDLMSPVAGADGVLRVGRQELAYGRQRLVSPLDWSNTRRTWDGGRFILKDDAWRIDAFATQFVPVEKYDFNEADSDTKFSGVYATGKLAEQNLSGDLYFLSLDRDGLVSGEETYDDERYTAGLRLNGLCPLTGVEFDAESGMQFGDTGDRDIDAWFLAIDLGYTFKDAAMQPRLGLGYDYASGDDDPTDDENGTFNQLFPLGHAYFGAIDIIGRQNIEDFSQSVSIWPVEKKVQLKLEYHIFRRAENTDALYNAGGGVVRAGDSGTSKDVGSEIDVTMLYKINRSMTANAGFGHFYAGDFIEESGPDSDTDFFYASIQYTF